MVDSCTYVHEQHELLYYRPVAAGGDEIYFRNPRVSIRTDVADVSRDASLLSSFVHVVDHEARMDAYLERENLNHRHHEEKTDGQFE